jgi:hypothetical protein
VRFHDERSAVIERLADPGKLCVILLVSNMFE